MDGTLPLIAGRSVNAGYAGEGLAQGLHLEKSVENTPKLTAERLRELLHYDPETGVFTWRVATGPKARVGGTAGRVDHNGYRYIGVLGQTHLASRLAWLYVYGEWPSKRLEYINRTVDDNRIENLRQKYKVDRTEQLTAQKLRELLDYDSETGAFTWRVDHSKFKAGQLAGCLVPTGYVLIGVLGRRHLAHRLAWLHVYGEWPESLIDHINHTTDDNRIANLRAATHSENTQNSRLSRRNKSGHKGVIWYRRDCVWRAYLVIDGRSHHLGYFSNINDAIAARKAAEAKYHPFAPKDAQHA